MRSNRCCMRSKRRSVFVRPEGMKQMSQEAQVSSGLKKAGILEFRYSFDRPAEPQGWQRSLP
jgi:hypothetical protein